MLRLPEAHMRGSDEALESWRVFGAIGSSFGTRRGLLMRLSLVVLCLAVCVTEWAYAQSSEEQVQKVNDAILAAAQKRDVAAYTKLAGDDLRWIRADGTVANKTQRLADLTTGQSATTRTFTEIDVKVYGNVAVLICRSDYGPADKRQAERVHRVFANRNGAWVLISHSATQVATATIR